MGSRTAGSTARGPALLAAACALALFGATGRLGAESRSFELPAPPGIDARAVVLIDFAKGEVLYANNADEAIPPASLTKIMTMHVAMDAVDRGDLRLDDIVVIRKEETSLPYGSSLMYLQPGMKVPFDDLLRGMAVISGNDAAFAVARVLAGSSDSFAELMNRAARDMGLGVTRFVEPSGLSEENLTTAREMAILSRNYLLAHPEAIEAYHSRTTMEFPRAEVMPEGVAPPHIKILLRNRNDLLFSYAGCDGLKTGFIRESGSNLVVTAEREGTRFILVTLGGANGSAARKRGATQLLDWAFANWKTVEPGIPALPMVKLWSGAKGQIRVAAAEEARFTVPRAWSEGIQARIELPGEIDAPVAAGSAVGRIVYTSGERVLRRVDIVAAEEGELGSFFVRLRDAIIRFFSRVFTQK